MEITTIKYRKLNGDNDKYTGLWSAVDGGVVLFLSENSQTFIPYHRIDSIEQTFSSTTERNEKLSKALVHRLRSKK